MAEKIDDLLRSDHERLNALWSRLKGLIDQIDPEAPRVLAEFSSGLKRHIEFEETELFPALRRSLRRPSERAIESLVIDHQVILEQLDLLRIHFGHRRIVEALQAAGRLETFLEGHNRDEEIGVYHDADRVISAADHASLVARFRSCLESAPT